MDGNRIDRLGLFLSFYKTNLAHKQNISNHECGGAVGLGVSAFTQASWPNFGLQVIWFFIGLYSLYKILHRSEFP